MSKAKLARAQAAFKELEKAQLAFQSAIAKFGKAYSPNSVGLDEMCESLDDFMFELSEDINETFEEQLED